MATARSSADPISRVAKAIRPAVDLLEDLGELRAVEVQDKAAHLDVVIRLRVPRGRRPQAD